LTAVYQHFKQSHSICWLRRLLKSATSTFKLPTHKLQTAAKNIFEESAGAKLFCIAAAAFLQSRSSSNKFPKYSIRNRATRCNTIRKTHSIKLNQKTTEERICVQIHIRKQSYIYVVFLNEVLIFKVYLKVFSVLQELA